MTRPANAIDMWRGLALITIFLNHIPGLFYARYTFSHYSISDSADLFVFLAGWSLRYVVGSERHPVTTGHVLLRLTARAFTLYVAQIFITLLAIAILAASAMMLDNPLLLEWHNAASVFFDPVPTHIGLVLLTHQLGYFDILPLYVVLIAAAPIFALIDRFAPRALLPFSLTVYVLALVFRINPSTWPVEGEWFFNPLAWQLVFVLGFTLAREDGIGAAVRNRIVMIRYASLIVLVVGLVIVLSGFSPDPTRVPQPRLFFILDKTYVTPIRIIQFLAMIAVFSAVFPYIERFAAPLVRFLAMFGRNSLHVFCIGSILSLMGQIVRYVYQGYLSIDTFVVIVGVATMALTAWLAEWRNRARPVKKAGAGEDMSASS